MIRVLVVDDSALVRRILCDELSRMDDIEVVGTASDAYEAREQIVALEPDVITLDIEMPRMDGLSFLATLMKHYPVPVIIVSSHSTANSDAAIRALALGAVDVIGKPGASTSMAEMAQHLARSVRAAAGATLRADTATHAHTRAPAPRRGHLSAQRTGTPSVIALGASTGGTQALEAVLTALPADLPGMVICQHMPEAFTASFARRLDGICQLEVREARDRDAVTPGVALIAPGNRHMIIAPNGGDAFQVRVKDGPRVHHQRPAVDVLFASVARHAGRHAVAALLTGMGVDGAAGMLQLHQAGAHTIAQDEASCVVFGMPREAIRLGAAREILPLHEIADALQSAIEMGQSASV